MREFNTQSYEGQMLSAALVVLSTEHMPDKSMAEIIDMLDALRRNMGYQTREDILIESVENTFNTKLVSNDTGIPTWCPPTCNT